LYFFIFLKKGPRRQAEAGGGLEAGLPGEAKVSPAAAPGPEDAQRRAQQGKRWRLRGPVDGRDAQLEEKNDEKFGHLI
jgi:hypothetical protein